MFTNAQPEEIGCPSVHSFAYNHLPTKSTISFSEEIYVTCSWNSNMSRNRNHNTSRELFNLDTMHGSSYAEVVLHRYYT